jgi:hypothetical protein
VTQHGPFHRLGQPGGPPAELAATAISVPGFNGEPTPAHLLDAGVDSSEVALLRAVCGGIGVTWGHDDLGWWAVVPG